MIDYLIRSLLRILAAKMKATTNNHTIRDSGNVEITEYKTVDESQF